MKKKIHEVKRPEYLFCTENMSSLLHEQYINMIRVFQFNIFRGHFLYLRASFMQLWWLNFTLLLPFCKFFVLFYKFLHRIQH